jgi:sigma-70-like protein
MAPLETLAPDQRAVLELVLRQGRSYGELSELLAIPEREVRARADAGLRALAGEPAGSVDSGRIADWLLGQQPDAEAERTRGAVARNAPAREWAATAADALRELGGAAVPDVPAGDEAPAERDAAPAADATAGGPAGDDARAPAADATAGAPAGDDAPAVRPRPRPLRDGASPRAAEPAAARAAEPAADREASAVPRSSRMGGAILLGIVAVLVAGFLVWMFALRGDDEESPAAGNQPAATATPSAAPTATANDIQLQGANGAVGFMRLIRGDDGKVRFGIAAEKVPPNGDRDSYAVWFTGKGVQPRRLGFAQNAVGEDGVLATAGPQKADEDQFPKWFATYEKVLVTKETSANAKKPGQTILEGNLPASAGG